MEAILQYLTRELIVLLTASLPVIELRGAIPLGVTMGLPIYHNLGISVLGSMLPVPFLLLAVRPLFKYLKKKDFFKNLIHKITNKTLTKSGRIQKYGFWGLIIFVAIPLPGTGVWSGAMAAALLNMRLKTAFLAILVGNMIAGTLVTMGAYGVVKTIGFFE